MKEQGPTPEKPLGIMEAMSQPEFEPVRERGHGNIMAGFCNRIREWTLSTEKTLERGLELAREAPKQVEKALGKLVPGLDRVASLFAQERQAGLAAALFSPSVQKGLGELAAQDRAAKERDCYLELERERERTRGIARERRGPSLSR